MSFKTDITRIGVNRVDVFMGVLLAGVILMWQVGCTLVADFSDPKRMDGGGFLDADPDDDGSIHDGGTEDGDISPGCGNHTLDPGEACDATSFSQSPDCTAYGYHGGWMTCRNDCTVDDSDCLAHGRCGDAALQPTYEMCDGAALDGQSCSSLGYYGGTLGCEAGCEAFAVTDCASHGRCGDGDIQSGYGEACDGQNMGGNTCQSLGLGIHGLSCSATCDIAAGSCHEALQLGGSDDDSGSAVATDAAGNLYLAGSTVSTLAGQSSAGGRDAFVIKRNADGSPGWIVQWGTSLMDAVHDIWVSDIGEVYVAGSTEGTFSNETHVGVRDAFVSKISVTGVMLWTHQYGSDGNDAATGLAYDGTYLYVTGYAHAALNEETGPGSLDFFVMRLTQAGQHAQTRLYGGWSVDQGAAITFDGQDLLVVGSANVDWGGTASCGLSDAMVIRVDRSDLTPIWHQRYGSSESDYPYAVWSDGTDTYVSGRTLGAFNGQSHLGASDGFLLKLDAAGNDVWTRQFGTAEHEFTRGLAVGSSGAVYVAGDTAGTVGALAYGGTDFVLYKFTAAPPEAATWTRQWGTPVRGGLETSPLGGP